MAKCELIDNCPFFNDLMEMDLGDVVEVMKETYCLDNNCNCARYIVYKAKGKPPSDLFPNETDKASAIVEDK